MEMNLKELVDLRDIDIKEDMDRKERINYLRKISKNGYVKYENVLIKLEFVSVFPEEYKEGQNGEEKDSSIS